MEDIFCQYDKIKEDILYGSPNFLVKVGLGLITSGHVMLVTKKHYGSFADLPDYLEEEFRFVKESLADKIAEAFSTPFLIECGNCGTVAHAHIHFIPKSGDGYEISNIIGEMVLPSGLPYRLLSRQEQKKRYFPGDKYVGLEDDGVYCVVGRGNSLDSNPPDSNPPEWWKQIEYRRFFTEVKGVKAVRSWSRLTASEKTVDERKREITKQMLRF